jgi:glycosyltransferase involved in cell wall biosynthesis
MGRKKILHVASISFSLKYFVGNQFSYFKKRGYDYTVVCSDSEDLRNYSNLMKFSIFPLPIIRAINPIQDLKSIYHLYKYIKAEKFDIIIAHSPKGGLIGMTAAFFAKTPRRIFFRHGLVFETTKGFTKYLLIYIEKIIAFFAQRIVCVSPSILKQSQLYNLNSGNKNIILNKGTCNGIDINRFKAKKNSFIENKKEEKIVIGFVGRLSRDKGIIELIEGWRIILKNNKNIELLLVGPFDERDLLPEIIVNEIRNTDTIVQVGYIDDTSSVYNDIDIFILPSYREGFPTVVLEASATAIPVITTRATGCIDSIIENQTGIYTNINSIDIARAIQFYIDNPRIRIEHGQNGRFFVESNFTEDVIYNEIEKLLLS